MQTVVVQSNSLTDMKLLTELAKKIGMEVTYISDEKREEIGLLNAIEKGRTGEYVDTNEFIKKLRQ